MNDRRDEHQTQARAARGVAPIYQLLGEGRLGPEALDAVVATLEAEGLPAVSEVRIARAAAIARRPRPAAAERPSSGLGGALRRLAATLVLDLRPWALPAGVRGAKSPGRRLLFAVDRYEIVLQEASGSLIHGTGRTIVGQVSRDDDPLADVGVVLVGPHQQAEADTDEDGQFRFRGLGDGRYELEVWAGDDVIVCAPVHLDGGPASPGR